jgi:hypothetical protein
MISLRRTQNKNMKINTFTPTRTGGHFADPIPYSSITGAETGEPISPEDEIINSIDEQQMSDESYTAKKFLEFLGHHRLKLSDLDNLSERERAKLRKEFMES